MANDGSIERIGLLKEKGLSFKQIAEQLDITKDQAQKLHRTLLIPGSGAENSPYTRLRS